MPHAVGTSRCGRSLRRACIVVHKRCIGPKELRIIFSSTRSAIPYFVAIFRGDSDRFPKGYLHAYA
ncbi:hypothetical protein DB31_0541 [Hyalangium minutum]|uniref:Uncharacterized protein n=1 Tax=Hyalangium minutum TaxID=394096 RepID=A0A085WX66_9BACT|nr:hypothetical protein DB31_0541 [Hyalangium minutum]